MGFRPVALRLLIAWVCALVANVTWILLRAERLWRGELPPGWRLHLLIDSQLGPLRAPRLSGLPPSGIALAVGVLVVAALLGPSIAALRWLAYLGIAAWHLEGFFAWTFFLV